MDDPITRFANPPAGTLQTKEYIINVKEIETPDSVKGVGANGVCPADKRGAYGNAAKKRTVYHIAKRCFDLLSSLVGLCILAPLFLVVAILIKREDGGSVFYRRICVGKGNRPYVMYKFRTMMVDADNRLDLFTPRQREDYLRGVKIKDDPRITKIGRFLRSTSIDELPQLISVLKSDMSLIGPRPVIEREAAEYGEFREHLLSCKPGITGYWQVMGRGTVPFLSDEGKQLQLYYVDHQGVRLDSKIFLKTIIKILQRGGHTKLSSTAYLRPEACFIVD